jgi:hypothetical protein
MDSLIVFDEEPFIADCDGGVDRRIDGSCRNIINSVIIQTHRTFYPDTTQIVITLKRFSQTIDGFGTRAVQTKNQRHFDISNSITLEYGSKSWSVSGFIAHIDNHFDSGHYVFVKLFKNDQTKFTVYDDSIVRVENNLGKFSFLNIGYL